MKTLNLKSKDIVSAMRFDGSYHISEGTIFLKKLKRMPHADLISFCPNIFTAGRNKRVYTDKEKGFPYLSNSDVVKNNPFESCNYNSKKYGFDKTAFLKEGMILTGRVGAIGQTSYVTKEFEENQAMGSDNIIRIVAKDKKMSGYIYAFLVSKYGNALFNRLAAGGVQPYISEAMLQDIPIPILPEEFQQKIHNLIVESAQLRVEANKMLKEAVEKIENFLREDNSKKSLTGKVSISEIKNNYQSRIDSPTYVNSSVTFWNQKKESKINFFSIEELGFKVTRPGIFKRVKVDGTNGIPYIKGSELNKLNPFSNCEYLSKSRTPFLDELKLKVNQILFTCAGTIGDVRLISKEFEDFNAIGSQDIIRIEENNSSVSVYYLFAFLKTNFAREFAQSLKYGSVIERVEPFHVDLIPVAIPEEKIYSEIISAVAKYNDAMYMAFNNEKNAIDLIEKEIDQWQQL